MNLVCTYQIFWEALQSFIYITIKFISLWTYLINITIYFLDIKFKVKTSHIEMMVNPMTQDDSAYLSMRLSRISVEMALGVLSPSLNTLSMTDSSVLVVSRPQKAIQSLTVIPAPITSLPLFTVPAYRK